MNIDWFFVSHRLPIAREALRLGYEVHLACSFTKYEKFLCDEGLILHPLKLTREANNLLDVFYNLLEIRELNRILRPDVIHLVTIKPVLLGCLSLHLLKVKPLIVCSVSGLGHIFVDRGILASFKQKIISILYHFAFKHKHINVIFQNNDDQSIIVKISSLPIEKSTIIRGSGIELSKYSVKQIPLDPPVVIFPARLLITKGILDFVEAAKRLRQLARFVVVGNLDSGNPACITKEQLDFWVNNEYFEYWGYSENISKTFGKVSLVVLPSYREGFPKVLMEAAACGRPVITTNVPGCRDAIIPGLTGEIVPLRDPDSLSDAIKRLVLNPDLLISMGKQARCLALEKYDINFVIDKHLDIYSGLTTKD